MFDRRMRGKRNLADVGPARFVSRVLLGRDDVWRRRESRGERTEGNRKKDRWDGQTDGYHNREVTVCTVPTSLTYVDVRKSVITLLIPYLESRSILTAQLFATSHQHHTSATTTQRVFPHLTLWDRSSSCSVSRVAKPS